MRSMSKHIYRLVAYSFEVVLLIEAVAGMEEDDRGEGAASLPYL